jgi:cytochrome b
LTNLTSGKADNGTMSARLIWDIVIRASAFCLILLVALAYFTGEETRHTHAILGYALATLLLTLLYWELVRPQKDRFAGNIFGVLTFRAIIQSMRSNSLTDHSRSASSLAILGTVLVLAVLAFCAILVMALTHTLWRAASVDEMHEVIAYFALGLVAFYVAIVVIASGEYVGHHLRRAFGHREHP